MHKKTKTRINSDSWSCLLYVTSFIWLFPASNFILPLMLWLLTKHKSIAIEIHGKNILNFQISWFLIGLVIWGLLCFIYCNVTLMCVFGTIPTYVLVFGMIVTFTGIFMVAAAVTAYRGTLFEFPLTYRFIK